MLERASNVSVRTLTQNHEREGNYQVMLPRQRDACFGVETWLGAYSFYSIIRHRLLLSSCTPDIDDRFTH